MNESELKWLPVNQEWDGGSGAPIVGLVVATGIAAAVVPLVFSCLLGPPQRQPSSLLHDVQQRAVLVVAHPDDEAMFFWPTLLELRRLGIHLSVLCLSTGNADGLGEVRKVEMQRSCASIGVTGSDLSIIDAEELQDGFHEWPTEVVARHVHEFVKDRQARLVLTFDGWGVSGHPNHVSTSRGVRHARDKLRAGGSAGDYEVLMLESVGMSRKYVGPLSLLLGTGSADAAGLECACCSPLACLRALAVHWSQLVWYRVLFTLFSRYAYVNSFVQLKSTPDLAKEVTSAG